MRDILKYLEIYLYTVDIVYRRHKYVQLKEGKNFQQKSKERHMNHN